MDTDMLKGFYKKGANERQAILKEITKLNDSEMAVIENTGALGMELADRMIENTVGGFTLPLGIATNFRVNGRDILVPMAIEEPSVVAAASHAAKLALPEGFRASTTDPVMIGQIQLTGLSDPEGAIKAIESKKEELIEQANQCDPVLVKFGGGARDIKPRLVESRSEKMVVVHLLVDTRDAMGANAVNTMAEALAPLLEDLTGGKVFLRILSNLAIYRLARAEAIWTAKSLEKGEWSGEDVISGIIKAWELADADPFRAATHNKGIMNGIDAVVIATGNDFRAVEAGAHAYAAMNGKYGPLTKYSLTEDGSLKGEIEIPMAVGLIGGATAVHPTAKACVKMLGVKTARELAGIIAAVGLAQNFAAIRALSTEGIQRGHMKLHARNIAATAGATGHLVDVVASRLITEGKIRMDRAKEILEELEKEK